jgi:2-dehydropantoate 2-reductase
VDALIVGAGTVGLVYGYHLQRGGARVSYLVKPKHLEEAAEGYTLYALKSKTVREPIAFRPHELLSSLDEVRERKFDSVWLCTPTTALVGPWFEGLADAIGSSALVALPPGMKVRERIRSAVKESRVVDGAIGFVSYQAPLPNETVPRPGVAFAFPPMTASLFGGERAADLVAVLKKGGLPAKVDAHAHRSVAFTSAVLQPLMVALEGAGWSFEALYASPLLKTGVEAAREALAITAKLLGARRPLWHLAIRPSIARLVFSLASRTMPFDFEAYLKVHFTKIGPQTRLLLPSYRFSGGATGIPTHALEALETAVFR